LEVNQQDVPNLSRQACGPEPKAAGAANKKCRRGKPGGIFILAPIEAPIGNQP